MKKDDSPRRKTGSWKARRAKAERMFAAGQRQSEVARLLGVSRQCIHNWFRIWQGATPGTLTQRRSGSGRKPKLSADHLAEVDQALRLGPDHFGFAGERWTLDRVAAI